MYLKKIFTLVAVVGLLSSCSTSSSSSATPAATSTTPKVANVTFESRETSIPIGYDKPKPGKFKLAYLNPVGGNEFLDALGAGMKQATEKLGGSFVSLDGKGSVDTQVSQLDQLIAQKVDGIFVFALDPNAMKPELAKAKKAGIKLISIDENFQSDAIGSYDSQVLQRRDEAAFLGAQQMAKLLPGGSSIGTIDFKIAVPSIVYSITQAKAWASKFGLTVGQNASNPSDDIAGGETAMTELIGKMPTLAGVIAYNDPSAIGASSAAKAQGKNALKFGGQNGGSDALEAVRAGRIAYTIQLAAPSIGKFAAWGIYDLKQGKTIPKTAKGEAPTLITPDNIASAKAWSEQLKAS
jgi:ABC-type sugar transport system substrate-binding protein